MEIKIGFIGGGNMSSSLIGGLIESGHLPSNIVVFEPNEQQAKQLSTQFQVMLAIDNHAVIQQSDVVVLAVKPQILKHVLTPLSETFTSQRPLIISIVAGIRAKSIESWLNQPHAIVRVMPNTPALINVGASGLYANERVKDGQRSIAANLLNSVGVIAWLPKEDDIDSITALSGSGPAYFMCFLKALIDSAIANGIEAETAKLLAVQTAIGAAKLVQESDESIATLIENVTSPNGTTEAALNSFQRSGLDNIVNTAFEAAKVRSEELADQLT